MNGLDPLALTGIFKNLAQLTMGMTILWSLTGYLLFRIQKVTILVVALLLKRLVIFHQRIIVAINQSIQVVISSKESIILNLETLKKLFQNLCIGILQCLLIQLTLKRRHQIQTQQTKVKVILFSDKREEELVKRKFQLSRITIKFRMMNPMMRAQKTLKRIKMLINFQYKDLIDLRFK